MHDSRKPMIKTFLAVLATVLCVAGYHSIATQAAAPAAAPPIAAPTVVVTIDLERAMNTLDIHTEAAKKLETKARELEAQRLEKVKLANEAEQVLDLLPKGTPKYDEAEKKFVHLHFEAKALIGFGKEKLNEMEGNSFRMLYKEVKDGLKTYSEERGYDFVLLNDCLRELESGGAREVQAQISLRRMLYYKPNLDITDDFIAWMNNRHKVAAGR